MHIVEQRISNMHDYCLFLDSDQLAGIKDRLERRHTIAASKYTAEAERALMEYFVDHQQFPEGDATAMYLHRQLAPTGVKVTRLARGLPTGGDLEYVDSVTLLRAFQGRHAM